MPRVQTALPHGSPVVAPERRALLDAPQRTDAVCQAVLCANAAGGRPKPVNVAAAAVLHYLAAIARPDGTARFAARRLAPALAMSRNTLDAALHRLAASLLIVLDTTHGGGRRRSRASACHPKQPATEVAQNLGHPTEMAAAGAVGGPALRSARGGRGGAERAGQGVHRGAGGGGAAPAERLRGGGSMSSAPSASRRARLREMLAGLRLPGALEAVDEVLADVDVGAATAGEAIERLLAAQIALRNDRRPETAMRASRLPAVKTLAEFDFAFQPSIKRERIESLHELGFLGRRENVVLLGPPGVGKTHLAVSLAIAAAQSGRRVYYGTLAGLIESLEHAKARCCSSSSSTPATSRLPPCSPRTKGFEEWAPCSATKSWPPPSSTDCCTTATSSTSAATATECASTRNCGAPCSGSPTPTATRTRRPPRERVRGRRRPADQETNRRRRPRRVQFSGKSH